MKSENDVGNSQPRILEIFFSVSFHAATRLVHFSDISGRKRSYIIYQFLMLHKLSAWGDYVN